MDTITKIIEDALLLAANEDVDADESTREAIKDLAARLYRLTGFDADAIRGGYLWVPNPDHENEEFALRVNGAN